MILSFAAQHLDKGKNAFFTESQAKLLFHGKDDASFCHHEDFPVIAAEGLVSNAIVHHRHHSVLGTTDTVKDDEFIDDLSGRSPLAAAFARDASDVGRVAGIEATPSHRFSTGESMQQKHQTRASKCFTHGGEVGRNTLYDTASLVYPISNHHSCVHHSMISTLQTHKVYAKNCGSEVLLQTNNNTTAIVKLLEGHAEGIKIASQAEAVVPRDEVKKDDEWIINDGVVGPEEESIDCGVLKNEVNTDGSFPYSGFLVLGKDRKHSLFSVGGMKRIAFLLMLVIQFVASDVSNVYVGEEGTTGVVPARPIDVAEIVFWDVLASGSKSKKSKSMKDPCPCAEPDNLCMSHKDHFHCKRGKEFSEKCENASMCFSNSCDDVSGECVCPTPNHCNGCNNADVPCLRVEHNQPHEICSMKAQVKREGKEKLYDVDLFDVGAGNSDLYTNLDRIIKASSSSRYCLSIVPFDKGSQVRLPPAFVQASVRTEDAQNIKRVQVTGLRDSLLGLQFFIDDHWITYVTRQELGSTFPDTNVDGGRFLAKSRKETFATIEKVVYTRVNVISFESLRDDSIWGSLQGKTAVVPIPAGETILDFDLPEDTGFEFVGEGPELSTVSIDGAIENAGRVNFKNVKVSFAIGTLTVTGPVVFQSSQIVNVYRCPPLFEEYNGACILVSLGIEQADDAQDFCKQNSGTLANIDYASSFLQSGKDNAISSPFAWIQPTPSADCSSIDFGGNFVEEVCEKYLNVLCYAPIRNPFLGEKYTSYKSDHFVGTYAQDYFKRSLDTDRIPFQIGGTLSFYQNDLYEEGKPLLFKAPDSVPSAVSVSFLLGKGNSSSIEIALDTFNSTGNEGYRWKIGENTTSLPTKIHLHANDSVCVQSVEMLVHNETGHSFVVARIPAKLFAKCLNDNVCAAGDQRLCGRSLMFYDEELSCARLEKDNSSIPRDLAINLLELDCARLTTWNHPNLGAPFYIEARVGDEMTQPLIIKEYFGYIHQYMFEDASNTKLALSESTVLPTIFLVQGGVGLVRSLSITRYGLNVSIADFSALWDCINVCTAFGNASGLIFSPLHVLRATLNLMAVHECQKLVEVKTKSGYGQEVCTSPPVPVDTISEVVQAIESMTASDTTFKTLNVIVTRRLVDAAVVTIPTNRGLILYQDEEVGSIEGSVENVDFNVADLAELFLVDLIVNGTTSISIQSLAKLELSGVDISVVSTQKPFLTNAGETIMESVTLNSNTMLKNVGHGRMQQTYVRFHDSACFVNAVEGVIRLSRLSLYEEFACADSETFEGSLELPDAKQLYQSLDDEEDEECFGDHIPDKTVSDIGTRDCQKLCDNEFLCSGVITYIQDSAPSCGLCLRESCSFKCSDYNGGAYYKAVSKFHFTKIEACPFISRPFKTVTDVTLEECKLYCSYYRSCEGFRVVDLGPTSPNSCDLIADLDFASTCSEEAAEEVYIPFFPDSTRGFYNIKGRLTSPFPIAQHGGIPVDQCARVCDKTISCFSFQVANETCSLFTDNNFVRSNEDTGLYLSVDDPFPKKRYMAYQSCYIPGSYRAFNIKVLSRCRDLCNEDYSCVGFAFRPLQSLSDNNCELYNSATLVNGVFGPDLGCKKQPLRRKPRDGYNEALDVVVVKERNLKSSKSSKSKQPSLQPSSDPSLSPSENPSSNPSTMPSPVPSNAPSLSPSQSSQPSVDPSTYPSYSAHPSFLPSISSIPSGEPSISVRPSQVSETYDLFVAFSTESYTVSDDRAFESVGNFTNMVEDECKAMCFYDSQCIAIRYSISFSLCEIGFLSDGSSVDNPYLVLGSLPADEASRYIPSNACYFGEKLTDHEGEVLITETTSGYFHLSETCINKTSLRNDSFVGSPAECGLKCSEYDACIGFIFFVDHGGDLNTEKFGTCTRIESFEFGNCDAVEHNMDLYLRADIGATCQAACNVHQLCSSFVFNETSCELYSDIELFENCPDGESPKRVHIGLSYRSRDGMVKVDDDQCFVEYEDLRLSGCYDFSPISNDNIDFNTSTTMTPWECQQRCKDEGEMFYAVHNIFHCSCGSEDFLKLPTSQNCTSPCPGDASQMCGGVDVASIGESGRPIMGLTLAQCKTECFSSGSCEAILFDTTAESTICELRSIGDFETCTGTTRQTIYVESLEHYYERPRASYIGSESIYRVTVELKQDCQKLCDAFTSCAAINYTETQSVLNCDLLGGDIIFLEEDAFVQGIEVAKDVALYTSGFLPESSKEPLAEFSTTFDLDECRTLCDLQVLCGSLEFASPNCKLYAKADFADVSSSRRLSSKSNHYIDYNYFVDPKQEFALADSLCVQPSTIPIGSRGTTRSSHDCARLCNSKTLCSLFTYDRQSSLCELYDDKAKLTFSDCEDTTDTFTMFTRSKFVEQKGACLENEDKLESRTDRIVFEEKTPFECAALCDKWFNCRSFRSFELSRLCQLFRSERFSVDSCPHNSVEGKLHVYYSDYRFTRLDNNFCVSEGAITSIENLPIEACKSICDKSLDCVSFQHTEVGLCVLSTSADFSEECTADDDRDLYISYKDVVDPQSRFLFNKLDSCFDLSNLDNPTTKDLDEDQCKEECEQSDDCFGIEVKKELTSTKCTILDNGKLPSDFSCGDTNHAFLKTKLNPYKKLEKTCLQNRIRFGDDGQAAILDKEDYECMALCNNHPSCRYFLHGNSTSATIPQLRECILFEAQPIEVDKCDNPRDDAKFINTYSGLTAYINGRTFIDQLTWFGEPERNFAKVSDLTYQECASLCDTLKECKAFIHTFNYRRAPLGSGRPLLFTNTRLTRLVFERDPKSLFLAFDFDTSSLILSRASSDDDVKKQLVLPELAGTGKFKLKFWSSSGKCLSAAKEEYNAVEDKFTRDVILANFGEEEPACERFEVGDCEDSKAISFKDFSKARFNQKVRLAYQNSKGCVAFHRRPNSFDFDIGSLENITNLVIPPILLNSSEAEEEVESSWCTNQPLCHNDEIPVDQCNTEDATETCTNTTQVCVTKTSNLSEPSHSFTFCEYVTTTTTNSSTPTKEVESSWCTKNQPQCEDDVIPTDSCSNVISQDTQDSRKYDIVKTCTKAEQNCTTSTDSSILLTVCRNATTTTRTTYYYLQKTTEDLLRGMYTNFSSECSGDGNDLISTTYSGNGCGFGDDTPSFPSQQFTWASDAVALQNMKFGHCLSDELKAAACEGGITVEWVYLFTYGHLYFADEENNMICLTRLAGSNSLHTKSCDNNNLYQSWEYNIDSQTIVAVSADHAVQECLAIEASGGTATLANCTDDSSKWQRFQECRLNTRESTGSIKVEKFQDSGNCIDFNSDNNAVLKSCDEAVSWRYYYDGNEARLELQNGEQQEAFCLGRRAEDYTVVSDENSNAIDTLRILPTGIVPCSKDKVVYWRNTIGGEENNILQWSLIKKGFAIEPQFCLDVGMEPAKQEECSKQRPPSSWRNYLDKGDATVISVKPSATLQDITDPEVLFQFYLFSPEGKSSRILRSRMAVLIRNIEGLKKSVAAVLLTTTEASNMVQQALTPIQDVENGLDKGAEAFKLFKTVLTPLARIPTIGPVFKGINVPVKAVENAMKNGKKAVGNVNINVKKAPGPLENFQLIVQKVQVALPLVYSLEVLVDMITRSSFCAYREDNTYFFDLAQNFIRELTSSIKQLMGMIDGLTKPLAVLNKFKADVQNVLLKPINAFKDVLRTLFVIIDTLEFLKAIAEFKIPVPYPKFQWKWAGPIPYPDVSFATVDFGLEEIGELIDIVLGALKKIPVIGWVIGFVEDTITLVIEKLFAGIGIEIPTFSIQIPFIDNLDKLIEDAKKELQDFLNFFNGIMDLGGIDDLIESIVDTMEKAIPSFEGIDLGCDEFNSTEECMYDAFNDLVQLPSLDDMITIPNISVGGVDFEVPVEFTEILKKIADGISSTLDSISDVFDDVGCDRYETLSVNIPEFINEKFLSFTDTTLPIPNCPINVDVCTSPQLPALESFSDTIKKVVEDVLSRRNRQLSLEKPGAGFERSLTINDLCVSDLDTLNLDPRLQFFNGGLSIPIPIEELIRRGSKGVRDFSQITNKLFKVFGQVPTQFYKEGSVKGKQFFFEGNIGIPSLTLLLGCDGGDFQAELRLGPLMDFTIGFKKQNVSPVPQADEVISYLPLPEVDFNCKFKNTAKCQQQKQDLAPKLEKWKADVESAKQMFDALCIVDFMYVTREMNDQFIPDVRGGYTSSPYNPNPFNNFKIDDLVDTYALGNAKETLKKIKSRSTSNKNFKDFFFLQKNFLVLKDQRDDLLQRIDKTERCTNSRTAETVSCLYFFSDIFTPLRTMANKDTCGHLYHPKYIHPPRPKSFALDFASLQSYGNDVFFAVGSYSQLYGALLQAETYELKMDSQLRYTWENRLIGGIPERLALSYAFKVLVLSISSLYCLGGTCDESQSIFEKLGLVFGCFDYFIRNNMVFLRELLPRIPLTAPKKFKDFFQKKVLGDFPLLKHGPASGGFNSLTDALLNANAGYVGLSAPLENKWGPLMYTSQEVVRVKFSFVSATINLMRDYESVRQIGSKSSSYVCEGKICFYPIDSDPKAILDPEYPLDYSCEPEEADDQPSLSPKPSTEPSLAPSVSLKPTKRLSSMPSDEPSLSQLPSAQPSLSIEPSSMPTTKFPSSAPSDSPSTSPTMTPSTFPSASPSISASPTLPLCSSYTDDKKECKKAKHCEVEGKKKKWKCIPKNER